MVSYVSISVYYIFLYRRCGFEWSMGGGGGWLGVFISLFLKFVVFCFGLGIVFSVWVLVSSFRTF